MGLRIISLGQVLLLAGCLFSFLSQVHALERSQPNIIIFLADDLGYGELGCQGNPEIPTPHIDRLATNGVRFTQAYVTAPNCSPSRAGLLTGRIPLRFGYEFNPIGAGNEHPDAGMPADETTIAEMLHDVGYTTGLIGKWHQGGTAGYHPQRHGFDEFFGFMHEGHYFVSAPYRGVTTMLRRKALPGNERGRWLGDKLIYSTHMGHDEPDYDANNPIIRGGQPVEEREYLTDAFSREAIEFIDRHQDKPFFLLVAYNAVHSPLQGADHYMQAFAQIDDIHRRIFAAMLGNLDDSVGAVMSKLDACKLQEQTIVFFLSDNGGPTRELTSSNLPLRGEKGQMYEGGVRVPFLMQWPATIQPGQVIEQPISSMDIFATAQAIAEKNAQPAERAKRQPTDGLDLLPLVQGAGTAQRHDLFFWRQGPRSALRAGDWKIVKDGGNAAWELYHITTDISETHDLKSQHPERMQSLIGKWEAWNAEMQPARFH
jgi:arylsulfatase B